MISRQNNPERLEHMEGGIIIIVNRWLLTRQFPENGRRKAGRDVSGINFSEEGKKIFSHYSTITKFNAFFF